MVFICDILVILVTSWVLSFKHFCHIWYVIVLSSFLMLQNSFNCFMIFFTCEDFSLTFYRLCLLSGKIVFQVYSYCWESFQHLKNVVVLPHGLLSFWWEIRCYLNRSSPIYKVFFLWLVSKCFVLSFVFRSLIKMCLSLDFFEFLLLKFVQPLDYVDFCLSTHLGDFQPKFLCMLFQSYIISPLLLWPWLWGFVAAVAIVVS